MTMIIVRAPVRVSFFGGGSDLPAFYRRRPGAVLSTTIAQYTYACVQPCFDRDRIRIRHEHIEICDHVDDVKHPLVRECMRMTGIESGVEITSTADLPSGTGLGSSSTFTVALLHALWAYKDIRVDKDHLAAAACRIEIDILGAPIGKQDQYAAAYGGMNIIEFQPSDEVVVAPLTIDPDIAALLERRLMLFYTDTRRQAKEVLRDQQKQLTRDETFRTQAEMVALVHDARQALVDGDVDRFGGLLAATWQRKRTLSSKITNPMIDHAYERARAAGAHGGKLLGAGGGGFLLIYCNDDKQAHVRHALRDLREVPLRFDRDGSRILWPRDQRNDFTGA